MNFFRRRNSKSKAEPDRDHSHHKPPPKSAPPEPPSNHARAPRHKHKTGSLLSVSNPSTSVGSFEPVAHPPNYNLHHVHHEGIDLHAVKKPNQYISHTDSATSIYRHSHSEQHHHHPQLPDDAKSAPAVTSALLQHSDDSQSQLDIHDPIHDDDNDDNTSPHILSSASNGRQRASSANMQRSRSKHSSLFSSRSVSHSSTALSAHSLVSISNSALSLLDYGIERTDVESAVCTLMDLTFPIRAIWVVARPIDAASMATRRFEHWCVKLHAQPALISMDFFESSGKGAFGISSVCASWSELEDFLHYQMVDAESKKYVKKPWKILSCVVPKKYNKITNVKKHMLPLVIGKNATMDQHNKENQAERIMCDYNVRDLADFLEEWVDDHKAYNSVGTNCQRFAYDVFKYLVGEHYPNKVMLLQKYFQSPLDRKKEILNRLKNHEDPRLDQTADSDESESDDEEDNKQEQDALQTEKDNGGDQDEEEKRKDVNVNNPVSLVRVESLGVDEEEEEEEETGVNNPDSKLLIESLPIGGNECDAMRMRDKYRKQVNNPCANVMIESLPMNGEFNVSDHDTEDID